MLNRIRNFFRREPTHELTLDELAERASKSSYWNGERIFTAEDIKGVWSRHPDWGPGGQFFEPD